LGPTVNSWKGRVPRPKIPLPETVTSWNTSQGPAKSITVARGEITKATGIWPSAGGTRRPVCSPAAAPGSAGAGDAWESGAGAHPSIREKNARQPGKNLNFSIITSRTRILPEPATADLKALRLRLDPRIFHRNRPQLPSMLAVVGSAEHQPA